MDERRLTQVLVDFALTLAADLSVQHTLDLFAEHVVALLPVDGAGILLMDDEEAHHFVAATDEVIVRIEALTVPRRWPTSSLRTCTTRSSAERPTVRSPGCSSRRCTIR